MSQNQSLDQGINYNLVTGNNAGGKAWANYTVNNLNVQGSVMVTDLAGTVDTTPFNLTTAGVINGILLCDGSSAVLNIPSGFAGLLLTALGGAVSTSLPTNNNILVHQGVQLLVVNATDGALTVTSADANSSFADPDLSIPAHGSRLLEFSFTALVNPTLVVY